MANIRFAFDKSARNIDVDGRLHVAKSHISKATVNPYMGKEIPGYESLGLDPEKIYQLFRDPKELEKAAPTFARLPVLSEHVPVTVDSPRPDLVVGAIGSDVEFNYPYLDADLSVWDSSAIAGIETEKVRELSCAYRYVPVMEPGEFEGQSYDGRMTEIQGNHLALVEVGRAGADVVVADHDPFHKFKDNAMKMTKLGKALFAALSAASPVLAADSALPVLVGKANRKTFDKSKVAKEILALDASIDSNKLDAVLDAIMDVDDEPKAQETDAAAADASPAEKLRAILNGKVDDAVIEEACKLFEAPAEDANSESSLIDEKEKKQPDMSAAMDAMAEKIKTEMRAANEAARAVRHVVGDVAMDSAEEIYGFALDHMSVDRKGVEGVSALKALFNVASKVSAQPVRVAQDSAIVEKQFPGLLRFGRA